MAYALDRLGFLQFQQVCAALLHLEAGIDPDGWAGSADRSCSALSEAPLGPPLIDAPRPGPVLVQCAWVRSASQVPSSALPPAVELMARAHHLFTEHPAQVKDAAAFVLVTNLSPTGAFPAEITVDGDVLPAAVIGPERLWERIDARPELRLRFPSVLGLRDLTPLIDPQGRSTFDRAAAEALAAVFVPTAAYVKTLAVLTRHRFAVLTGPPEMGKTAIARTLALALLTDGWEAHECTRPEQLFAALDPTRRQVFVADDAFGSTEYRPDAAERWSREMERILRALDDHHWLIWTSRPAPLRAGLDRMHRQRGAERFPAPGEVLVDAGRLTAEEKALILFRHAKAAALAAEVRDGVRQCGTGIVAHRHFTPERIRRLAMRLHGESLTPVGIAHIAQEELSQTSEAMVTSFTALAADQRELLIAMLDSAPGPTGERELAATVRRHHPGGLPRPVARSLPVT